MDGCTLLIYYHRPDGCYREWKLWVWETPDDDEAVLSPQLVQPAQLVWTDRALASLEERGIRPQQHYDAWVKSPMLKPTTGEQLTCTPIVHWSGLLFQVSLPASRRRQRSIGILPVIVAEPDQTIIDKDSGGDRYVFIEADRFATEAPRLTYYLHQGLSLVADHAAAFGLNSDPVRLYVRRQRASRRSEPFGLRMQWTHWSGCVTECVLTPDCGWSPSGALAPWESVFGLRFSLPRFLFQYWLEACLMIEPGTWCYSSRHANGTSIPVWTANASGRWSLPLNTDAESTDEWYTVEDETQLFSSIEDIPLRGDNSERRFLLIRIQGLTVPFPLAVFDASLSSVAEITADACRADWALYLIDRQAYSESTRLGIAVVDPMLDDPLPRPQYWLQTDVWKERPLTLSYVDGHLNLSAESFHAPSLYRVPSTTVQRPVPLYRRGCALALNEAFLKRWLIQKELPWEMHFFRGVEQTVWVLLREAADSTPEGTSSVSPKTMTGSTPTLSGEFEADLMLFEPHWGTPYLFPARRCLIYVWYRRYSREFWHTWRLWVLAESRSLYSSRVITWDDSSDRALFIVAVPRSQLECIELRLTRDDKPAASFAEASDEMMSATPAPDPSNWDVVRSWDPTMPDKEIFLLQGREQVYSGAEIEAAELSWLQEQYLEIAYLRPRFDYDGWHLWLWDVDDPSSTGREVAPLERAAVDAQHPHVEALVFRIDRGWFGAAQKLGFLAKRRDERGTWTEQDGPDRLWVLIQGVPRVVCLQGRAQVVQSVDDFVLEVTPYFEGDRLELCFPFPPWWKRLHQPSASVSEMDASAADNASSAETDLVEQAARHGQHFHWQGRAPTREPTHQQMQRHSSERVEAIEDDLLEALEVTMYWMPAVPSALSEDSPGSTELDGATDHRTESKTSAGVVGSSPTRGCIGSEKSASRLTDRFRHWSKNRKEHPMHCKTRSIAGLVADELPSTTEPIKTSEPALPRIVRVRAGSNPLILQFELDRELDEDFPVENVMVHLRGFSPSRAAWRRYEHVDAYLYDGKLGWEYSPTSTVFRVFAPTADRVALCLYREPVGSAGRRELPMRRIPQGVWKIVVSGDLKGTYYTYRADGTNKRLYPGVEVIDPYSRCNTAHDGRGLIYGEDHTPIADRPQIPPEHTIIYEVNLRDFTIDERAGVADPYRGKYLGLAQHGTRLDEDWVRRRIVTSAGRAAQFLQDRATPDSFDPQPDSTEAIEDDYTKLVLSEVAHQAAWTDRSTCLDHVLFLGVNTLQIMPVQDFDNDESNPNDYHWGYMPVHFFSPDGWYASCTTDASRVRELKQLIDALHKAGLKVVLDMVLNHTAEDPNEFNLEARFSFNGLAPRYYYRFWPDGSWGVPEACYANGSGCGNEFRSESPMGRKFILDMLSYWATEYKVDGFRFDLMGLMDRETLRLAAARLHAIDPGILIYGEPWSAGETPLIITGKGAQRGLGFGVFNDTFRNALRGSNHGIEENFLLDGGCTAAVKRGIRGSIDDFADTPLEVINYVECHDNRTLWDHLWYVIQQRADPMITYRAADVVRVCKLAAVILLTSQGIPFLHSGQEMARTKFGDENSYQSGDRINRIRWERKIDFYGLVTYVRGLIGLRRARPDVFAIRDADEIRRRICFYEELGLEVPERCIAYRIIADPATVHEHTSSDAAATDPWRCVALLFNPTPVAQVFPLPPEAADELMAVIVNGIEPPRNAGEALGEYHVGHATVPGRSAMVLRLCTEAERERALVETRLNAISEPYSSTTDLPGLYSSYATPPWSKNPSPAPMDE